jgi:hypothetical protein
MANEKSCKDVIPANSARMFRNPAPILSMSRVRQSIEHLKGGAVLDVGGGCLRNAVYLQAVGFKVSVLEVQGMEGRFPDQYAKFKKAGGQMLHSLPKGIAFDWAIATFVIETIGDPGVRKELMTSVCTHIRHKGVLVLSVRGPRDLVTAQARGIPCSDGYFTPGRTFSRAYTPLQLSRFLTACGFKHLEFLHKKTTKEPELLHVIAEKGT